MILLDLPNDILYNIINKIDINKLYIIEQVNKSLLNIINNTFFIKYNYSYDILKTNIYSFNNRIDILNKVLFNKNSILNKLLYHTDNISFRKLIKNSFVINTLDIIKNKDFVYKIIYIYYNLFNEILLHINKTYLIFIDINKYKRNNNIYYLYVNIKYTYKNFYDFLNIFKYLKYLNYNKVL